MQFLPNLANHGSQSITIQQITAFPLNPANFSSKYLKGLRVGHKHPLATRPPFHSLHLPLCFCSLLLTLHVLLFQESKYSKPPSAAPLADV